ncbi:hypothetical protein RhiirA1_407793, partial [Rhizophagus irregularis]
TPLLKIESLIILNVFISFTVNLPSITYKTWLIPSDIEKIPSAILNKVFSVLSLVCPTPTVSTTRNFLSFHLNQPS